MLKIGLTGGIGSGKTTVAGIFKVLGIPVFDADSAAKKLMETDEAVKLLIRKEFGDTAYNNGQLDRKFIAGVVFNDAWKLERLNSIVHPAAIAAGLAWAERQSTPYVIKEAALLFEAGSAFNTDIVIGVSAPEELRIKRAMGRDGISREQVIARMDKQIDEEIKLKLCDFVMINDEQDMLIPQVLKLHEYLLGLAKQ